MNFHCGKGILIRAKAACHAGPISVRLSYSRHGHLSLGWIPSAEDIERGLDENCDLECSAASKVMSVMLISLQLAVYSHHHDRDALLHAHHR